VAVSSVGRMGVTVIILASLSIGRQCRRYIRILLRMLQFVE